MIRIKYSADIMRYISFFEALTGAKLKDCFIYDSQLVFVVHEGEAGKAIGRSGSNIQKIELSLKKRAKIIEFSDDLARFVSSVVYPLKVRGVKEENGLLLISGGDTKTKALLIGRDSHNLRKTEETIKRYFDIKQVKVV